MDKPDNDFDEVKMTVGGLNAILDRIERLEEEVQKLKEKG